MSSLEALTGSPFLSYSSLESWLSCGEKWRLEKVIGVARTEAWYLLGGSAVHEATELLDKKEVSTPDEAWAKAWAKQLSTIDNIDKVRAGGRATKEYPNKEDSTWWTAKGLEMVRSYNTWCQEQIDHGWSIIGVEVPFELELGEVKIRGFVDRVFSDENGVVRVVDIKTGSRSPASNLQLGCYAVGVQQALGVSPTIGNYYMARNATLTHDASLLHYTPELLEHWFGMAKKAIEAEVFIPHVTSLCGTCTVAAHCTAVGGRPPVALSSAK